MSPSVPENSWAFHIISPIKYDKSWIWRIWRYKVLEYWKTYTWIWIDWWFHSFTHLFQRWERGPGKITEESPRPAALHRRWQRPRWVWRRNSAATSRIWAKSCEAGITHGWVAGLVGAGIIFMIVGLMNPHSLRFLRTRKLPLEIRILQGFYGILIYFHGDWMRYVWDINGILIYIYIY